MKVPIEIWVAFTNALHNKDNKSTFKRKYDKWTAWNWDFVSADVYINVDQKDYDIPLQEYIDYLIENEVKPYHYKEPTKVYLYRSEGKPAI